MSYDFVAPSQPLVRVRLWPLLLFRRGPLRQWGICLVRNQTKVSKEPAPEV